MPYFALIIMYYHVKIACYHSPISSLIYFPFFAKLNLHSFISEFSSFSRPSSHFCPSLRLNFFLIIILLSSLSSRPHVFSLIALLSSFPSLPPNSLFFYFNLTFYLPRFPLILISSILSLPLFPLILLIYLIPSLLLSLSVSLFGAISFLANS